MQPQPKPPRPTGVTILGVLAILAGIAGLIGGLVLVGLGILLGTLATSIEITNALTQAGYPGLGSLGIGLIATIVVVFGVIVLLIGILELATGIGFFGGKGWAWTLGIIVSALNIIIAIVEIAVGSYGSVLSLIFSLLILYYLMRPHVKAFFGKGPPMGPMMGSGAMTGSSMTSSTSASTGPMGTSSTMIKCSNCGTSVVAGTTKCPACGANL